MDREYKKTSIVNRKSSQIVHSKYSVCDILLISNKLKEQNVKKYVRPCLTHKQSMLPLLSQKQYTLWQISFLGFSSIGVLENVDKRGWKSRNLPNLNSTCNHQYDDTRFLDKMGFFSIELKQNLTIDMEKYKS
ncbi:hypothetical protein RF11_11377 [Thelohanellus kitauei]|uniref:Uncharacterized protein n=1 Tax=Thelohanellus kitauei TaxID=669202 RepID=A0A0C2NL11_THEKT|nr:hypothetical protein RF11_11377 [Thelohanellus kitauei]